MSKSSILAAIRSQQAPPAELPALQETGIRYSDPLAQFATVLQSVGGAFVSVADLGELNVRLEEIPAWQGAKQKVSLVPGAGTSNVDLAAVEDPHELESVDFAILPGHFGVAENGAVWVTDQGLRHRVIFFITQHLALVIKADQIVNNLHEAYEKLEQREGAGSVGPIGAPWFGTFISGPSKTADIEQSLVIGAHGPRSLTVYCLRPARSEGLRVGVSD
jgi:L-lactate dehydrogenase complex protein LldG